MNITTDNKCNIIIKDTDYPVQDNQVSLYIAQLNKSNKSINIYTQITNSETITLEPGENGFITVCHIILPKSPTTDSISYYSDGTYIYKKVNNNSNKLEDWQELIEINNPPFIRNLQNFFSVCYLRKCYVSLCQKIFNDRGFDRCFNGKVDSQLIYKRDLVWAALNVIQYMIDSNQLAEAQRLLERINSCNGLCSSEDTGEKGCGCE